MSSARFFYLSSKQACMQSNGLISSKSVVRGKGVCASFSSRRRNSRVENIAFVNPVSLLKYTSIIHHRIVKGVSPADSQQKNPRLDARDGTFDTSSSLRLASKHGHGPATTTPPVSCTRISTHLPPTRGLTSACPCTSPSQPTTTTTRRTTITITTTTITITYATKFKPKQTTSGLV